MHINVVLLSRHLEIFIREISLLAVNPIFQVVVVFFKYFLSLFSVINATAISSELYRCYMS